MPRTAWIAGASGLVGSRLLRRLLDSPEYSAVVALVRGPLVRGPLDLDHPKLDQRTVDFERLAEADLPAPDDVFSTLGTTIKKAGGKEAFRRIDHGYSRALAERAAQLGARRFLLVTSVAADARSPNFYLRVKAELEADIAGLPFESVHYFRPSFLMGERQENRPAERLGIALARTFQFLLFGPMRLYRPIDADQVAAAMVRRALAADTGRHIHHYDNMLQEP